MGGVMRDLFGVTVPEEDVRAVGRCQRWKHRNRYRRSTERERRCATCQSFRRVLRGRVRQKCIELGMSHTAGTDIAARNICDLWRAMAGV